MLPLDVDKRNSIIAALVTLAFCLLLFGCCFWLGMYRQNPPPPEEGVEVNVGDSDFGSGDSPDPVSETAAAQPKVNNASNELSEDISTQSTDETVALDRNKKKPTEEKPQQEVKEEVEQEPEINQRAIFPGNKNKANKGGSQGVTTGTGNQGKEGGDPNSNRYDGTPGKGGAGYSLTGRKAAALPKPNYNSNKQGKVVVKIWVDRKGNVIKAEPGQKGSTTTDAYLLRKAKEAAMQAKFTPNNEAQEQQIGTITYDFRNFN